MSAVLDIATSGTEIVERPALDQRASHLKAYQFQPGHAPHPRVGRPKGVRNSQTILLKAAPKLIKSYIRRAPDSDAICIDARKWILPVESQATILNLRFSDAVLDVAVPCLSVDETLTQARPATEIPTEAGSA